MNPKVLFAGLFHETNTFLDRPTTLADFSVTRDAEFLSHKGDSSPLGGALEFAAKRRWEIVPSIDYRALPGGTVADEVVEAFWDDLRSRWQSDIDAIFFVLHGAMVSDSHRDVEGEILRRTRNLRGALGLPLFGVYDLHGNFTDAMVSHSTALFAYRKNPTTDARETAIRATRSLDKALNSGRLPRTVHFHTGLIWPPGLTGTSEDPMLKLGANARQMEASTPALQAINIAPGFAFADTPHTGLSFQAITGGDHLRATKLLRVLEKIARELHTECDLDELSPEDALDAIADPCDGLTVLLEPSDNIGAGAPGDATDCLSLLIQAQAEEAAVAINDPIAVAGLEKIKPGESVTLEIGGRNCDSVSGPLSLKVELVSKSDGRFELEDDKSHLASMFGDTFDMGPSAVVKTGGILILLTSHRTPPFDLAQWRSQGIDPAKLKFIVVKASVAHRRAYAPITARTLVVDTPGPTSNDLSGYEYQFAPTAGLFLRPGNAAPTETDPSSDAELDLDEEPLYEGDDLPS